MADSLRVALCQFDPEVGDIDGNCRRIVELARRAADGGAAFAVFPELAIAGYPPRDLLDRPAFIVRVEAALPELAAALPRGITVAVGTVTAREEGSGRALFNAAAIVGDGAVLTTIEKRLLPTYDVFDEARYFTPGTGSAPIAIGGFAVGITICEDAWNDTTDEVIVRRYPDNPVAELVKAGASLLINMAASPFTVDKLEGRPRMLATMAARHGVPILFVNQVGGNDDLLFDGRSAAFGADGSVGARAQAFAEDLLFVDCSSNAAGAVSVAGRIAPDVENRESALLDALTLGTRDYAHKCGFGRAVLGLSGGIDSALVAAIAAAALGSENVIGIAMPTRYSSAGSIDDASSLAEALGIEFRVVGIDSIFQVYLDELTPHLDAIGSAGPRDVTFENVQSRIRCATLMAVSNRTGCLLLTTGNKSEIAVGYCTLYGDMAGGLAVISDLPKTTVYRVAREVNRRAGRAVIPESTLIKAPSAELAPDQKDEDSLPPYEVLDGILERHIEDGESAEEIIAAGFDRDTVLRVVAMVFRNEYKRRQMPPGLIVASKAFGPGRRYPIAQGFTG